MQVCIASVHVIYNYLENTNYGLEIYCIDMHLWILKIRI